MTAGEITGITRSVRFENAMHMTNFFNYLYRTDKGQKWTNELTVNNVDFLADGSKWKYVSDFNERREYKLEKHRAIAKDSGVRNVNEINVTPFEIFIVYFTDETDPNLVAQDAYNRAAEQDRWEIVAMASHLDQPENPFHIHIVGRLKNGNRRKPGEDLVSALYGD